MYFNDISKRLKSMIVILLNGNQTPYFVRLYEDLLIKLSMLYMNQYIVIFLNGETKQFGFKLNDDSYFGFRNFMIWSDVDFDGRPQMLHYDEDDLESITIRILEENQFIIRGLQIMEKRGIQQFDFDDLYDDFGSYESPSVEEVVMWEEDQNFLGNLYE